MRRHIKINFREIKTMPSRTTRQVLAHLAGSGEVTRVEIVEANPRRVFDRAVVRALSQWKYPSGNEGRTVDIDFEFRR